MAVYSGGMRGLLAAIVLLAAGVKPALSQSIMGRVFDDSTGALLAGVAVSVVDSSGHVRGSAISDHSGGFVFMSGSGFFKLRVDGFGVRNFMSRPFEVIDGRRTEIDLRVTREAVRLETVTVAADAQPFAPGPLRDFYSRTRRGFGHYLTREQIEQRGLPRFTSLLQLMPGVRIVRMPQSAPLSNQIFHYTVRIGARKCPPTLYLDGMNLGSIDDASHVGPDRILFPSELEGVEVYRPSQVPGEFLASEASCGVIVVWTKRAPAGQIGPDRGPPMLWRGGGGVGLPGADRSVLEISFRPAKRDRFSIVARIQVGEFNPSKLFGADEARRDGFSSGQRPLLGSVYVGEQGPLPVESLRRVAFTRLAAGVSFYGGEEAPRVMQGDSSVILKPSITPRVGLGGEWAVGLGLPSGIVRPWIELSTGAEYIARVGLRPLRPAVLFGIELGRRSF